MHTLYRIALLHVPLWSIVLIYGVSIWAALFLYMHVHSSPIYDITLPAFAGGRVSIDYGPQPSFEDRFYFNSVKEVFVENESSFILADLTEMEMKFYKDGEVILSFPIAAKGKEKTWTETPAGLYAVEWKTESHHSSLYNVTMPYSIQFFGNYFIHGWPYHPDGRAVVSSTSAGCIRLDTDSAAELYRHARPGMPVLVFEESYSRDDFSYFNTVEETTAESYLAIDLKSDFIFSEKRTDGKLSIGSFSRLPMALIASERMFVGMSVTVPEKAFADSKADSRFRVNEEVTLFTLLGAILMESSPIASGMVADRLGKDIRSTLNNYVRALGMKSTFIEEPLGADSNVSTVEDTVTLSKYLYFNRSSLLEMSEGKITSPYLTSRHSDLSPIHSLDSDPSFVGGYIPHDGDDFEGFALAIFEPEFSGMKRPVAIIVSGSSEPIDDIWKILKSVRLTSEKTD